MYAVLGSLSFMGFLAFGIVAIVSAIKKNGKGKLFGLICGGCFVLFIVMIAADPSPPQQAATNAKSEPVQEKAVSSEKTTPPAAAETAVVKQEKPPEPAKEPPKKPEPTVTTFKLNETAKAGNLAFVVSDVRTASFIGDNQYLRKKTENLFVIIKIKISNNDKSSRTIDTNLFKLKDSSGKEYSAMADADLYVNDPGQSFFLAQVNPGIDKTGNIVFEIPQGLSGLKLECSSGLGFTGGKFATIDLGI